MAVTGNNITLAQIVDGSDFVFACGRSGRLSMVTELKEVTSYNSNFYKEFRADVNNWQMSMDGVMQVNTSVQDYKGIIDLWKLRQTIRVKFLVDNGADGLLAYVGDCIIADVQLSGSIKEIGTYSMTLQGTGELDVQGAFNPGFTPATVGIYIATGGELNFTPTYTPAFVAPKTAYYVSRGGIQVEQIFNDGTTPTNNDVSFNVNNGELELALETPAIAGEFFRIICQ